MNIVYATDIHGREEVYEKLLEMGKQKEIKAVVIGGDISPGFAISGQREFLESYLVPTLKAFKKTRKPVLLIMGNDDYNINLDLLERAEKAGLLHLLHMKTVRVGDFSFVGYNCINPAPFLIRDWMKEDEDFSKDLEQLRSPFPRKTVYVLHAPPFNTSLDVIWNGEHVGSKAIRSFLLQEQPLLSLHGHIHESPDITGKWKDTLGKTMAINPGNETIVIIDLKTLDVRKVGIV